MTGDQRDEVMVMRPADEVFNADAIASANGKAVTLDHPPDGVLLNPGNWKHYAVGTVQNPHQGEGVHDDVLLADLLIKDHEAIRAVLDGEMREVSCGYDAEYDQDGPGRAKQRNIMINHVALVPEGRCGPRCAIHDSKPGSRDDRSDAQALSAVERSRGMAVTDTVVRRPGRGVWARFFDRARAAASSDDKEELERLREEAEEKDKDTKSPKDARPAADDLGAGDSVSRDGVHIHLHRHSADDEGEVTGPGAGAGSAEEREAALNRGNEGQGEVDLPQLAQDVAEIKEILADLADAEEEEVSMMREEEEDPDAETADRRKAAHDQRAHLRDRLRKFRGDKSRTRDANVESLPLDPEISGVQPYGAGPGLNKVVGATPAKLGTGDRARRVSTRDSSGLKVTFEGVVAQAEILAPGIRVPTFDAAILSSQTEERICALRRRTLDAAYRSPEGEAAIEQVLGGKTLNLKTATCDSIAPIFNAASAIMAAGNRARSAGTGTIVGAGDKSDMPSLIADRNRRMRERFDKPLGR